MLRACWARAPAHHPDPATEPWGSPRHVFETTVLALQFIVQLGKLRHGKGKGQLQSRIVTWEQNQVPRLCLGAPQKWTPWLPTGPRARTHSTALGRPGYSWGTPGKKRLHPQGGLGQEGAWQGWLVGGSGRLWTRLRKSVAGVLAGRSAGGTHSLQGEGATRTGRGKVRRGAGGAPTSPHLQPEPHHMAARKAGSPAGPRLPLRQTWAIWGAERWPGAEAERGGGGGGQAQRIRRHWGLGASCALPPPEAQGMGAGWGFMSHLAKEWTEHLIGCPPPHPGIASSPQSRQRAAPSQVLAVTRLSLLEAPAVHGLGCGQRAARRPRSTQPTWPGPPWSSHEALPSLPTGDQEALQPHPGGDLPLPLVPPPHRQPHFLHSGAGKGPAGLQEGPGAGAGSGRGAGPHGRVLRTPRLLLRSAFLPGSSQEAETLHPGWGQCVHFPRASGGHQRRVPGVRGAEGPGLPTGKLDPPWPGPPTARAIPEATSLPTGVPPPTRVCLPRQQPERRLLHQRQHHGQVPVLR